MNLVGKTMLGLLVYESLTWKICFYKVKVRSSRNTSLLSTVLRSQLDFAIFYFSGRH